MRTKHLRTQWIKMLYTHYKLFIKKAKTHNEFHCQRNLQLTTIAMRNMCLYLHYNITAYDELICPK